VVSLAGPVAQKVHTVPGEGPNGTDYSPVGKASQGINPLVRNAEWDILRATEAMRFASNAV